MGFAFIREFGCGSVHKRLEATPGGRSAFSKPASQLNPDSANWNAPMRPLAITPSRPRLC